MVSTIQLHRYTYEQYLAFEESSNVRHEFLDGEIYAMAGGTPQHARICGGVLSALGAQLQHRPCEAYSSDLRIRVLETGLATYPDVTIVCGQPELDPLDRNAIINPTIVIEVLSPGTATYDRGEKVRQYKLIPSLREIVLVAHDEILIEVWQRGSGQEWSRREVRSGVLTLASIECTLAVDVVFRNAFPAK